MHQFAKWLTAAALLLLFLLGLSRVETGTRSADLQNLDSALRRTAAACYASEGVYPPDVAYMQQHYGLQYDESRFFVHYEVFASNIMPEITVLEK